MYKIVVEDTLQELEEKIDGLMYDGWNPSGGICVAPDYGRIRYFQAMIKYSV